MTTPALKVQRMGRKFRIVYVANRNLARYNSGQPVDNGGFEEETDAMIHLAKVMDEQGGQRADPEAENIG